MQPKHDPPTSLTGTQLESDVDACRGRAPYPGAEGAEGVVYAAVCVCAAVVAWALVSACAGAVHAW